MARNVADQQPIYVEQNWLEFVNANETHDASSSPRWKNLTLMVSAMSSNIIIICVRWSRFCCIPTFISNNRAGVHLTQWCSLLNPLCHIVMQPWRRLAWLQGCNTTWFCSGAAWSPCVMFFVSSWACNSQTQCSRHHPCWPALLFSAPRWLCCKCDASLSFPLETHI